MSSKHKIYWVKSSHYLFDVVKFMSVIPVVTKSVARTAAASTRLTVASTLPTTELTADCAVLTNEFTAELTVLTPSADITQYMNK